MRTRTLFILCLAALSGCSDTVTDEYATLQDAIDDRLFERGWLPDILPESANRIRTSNVVDVNTSEGEFHFAASDLDQFISRLEPYANPKSRLRDLSSLVNAMTSSGYKAYQFVGDRSTWVFFIHPEKAHCEYTMSSER